jgi:hypothetical protein
MAPRVELCSVDLVTNGQLQFSEISERSASVNTGELVKHVVSKEKNELRDF